MPLPAILAGLAPYAVPLATTAASGLAGFLGNKLGSSGSSRSPQNPQITGRFNQTPIYSGQQQQTQNLALSQIAPLLQNINQGFDFGPIEQQARTQFSEQTIPSIANRFSALNAQRSSAFNRAKAQAGATLEQNLAAMKAGYGLQQQGMQQNLLNSLLHYGLQPNFQTQYIPRQPGFFEGLAPGIGQAIPYAGLLAALRYLYPVLASGGSK